MSEMRPGTGKCAAVCAVLGMILAVLLLTIGLWKTLFIALMGLVGAFIGGVSDKKTFAKNAVDRIVPGDKTKKVERVIPSDDEEE